MHSDPSHYAWGEVSLVYSGTPLIRTSELRTSRFKGH